MSTKPPLIKITVCGKDYSLRPELGSVMKIEDFFDMGPAQIGTRLAEGKFKTMDVATCVKYMINEKDSPSIQEIAEDVVGQYPTYISAVGDFIVKSMVGGDKELEDLIGINEDPPGGTEGN